MEAIKIDEIKKRAHPLVAVPGWEPGEVTYFRLQMPNLLKMAQQGKIPNSLLEVAASLTGVGGAPKQVADPKEKMNRAAQTIEIYCRACMVEPSYEEAGEYLTDDQMAYIFNWGRGDLQALEPFRSNAGNGAADNNSKRVQKAAK